MWPIFDKLLAEGKITEDTIPEYFTGGGQVYPTPGLEDISLPWVILREHLVNAAYKPNSLVYFPTMFSKRFLAKRVLSNIRYVLSGRS